MDTLVDGHVHLHPGRSLDRALSCAARRFAALCGEPIGVLCLTESQGIDAFGELLGAAGSELGSWTVERTAEDESVRCTDADGARLYVLAGRQVVAAEDLEVLGLATAAKFDDGEPFVDAVEAVRRSGAVTVIPWGFGKWWWGRGRLVRAAFDGAEPSRLFAGDNGGRWHAPGMPALLREVRSRGFRVLPGSDPLPLEGQSRRIGSAGFRLPGRPDPERPAGWLRTSLRDPRVDPVPYGGGVGLSEFLGSQVRMQLRKRARSAA